LSEDRSFVYGIRRAQAWKALGSSAVVIGISVWQYSRALSTVGQVLAIVIGSLFALVLMSTMVTLLRGRAGSIVVGGRVVRISHPNGRTIEIAIADIQALSRPPNALVITHAGGKQHIPRVMLPADADLDELERALQQRVAASAKPAP
jgi:hypothetical protein